MEESRKERRNHPLRTTLLLRLLPAVLALALLGAGLRARDRYESRQAVWEKRLESLAEERDAALAELSAVDPSAPGYAGRWERLTGEILAGAEAEAVSLESELEDTEKALRAAEEKMARWMADEEYVYYRTVYDAWEKGRTYVEELLSEG